MQLAIKKALNNFKNSRVLIKRRALNKLKKGRIFHTGSKCHCGVWTPLMWHKTYGFGVAVVCGHSANCFRPLSVKTLESYLHQSYFQKRWGLIKN